ncbi:MAG: hypothetical protein AB7S78_13235 [Candidatus Omnitrophota bacterium]
MKKNVLIFMAVVLFAASGLVYAQEMKGGMMGSGMMGKGMMDGKMMGMHSMMMKMMDRNVVATSDGGIVIVSGNKVAKFDKDLNLVKEVELKMDTEGMRKMMDNMKNICPMMGKGMAGNSDHNDAEKMDSPAKTEDVDHSSHH